MTATESASTTETTPSPRESDPSALDDVNRYRPVAGEIQRGGDRFPGLELDIRNGVEGGQRSEWTNKTYAEYDV